MGIEFSAVSRKTPTAVAKASDTTREGYLDALEFFRDPENEGLDLSHDFESVKARDEFVIYARAQSETDGMKLRCVVNEKGAARLVFRMYSETEYLRRQEERKAKADDLAKRKAAGEVIKRGRKAAK